MAAIRIDIDQLTTALSDHDSEWVLDLQTGEVLMKEWVRDPKLRGDMGLVLDEPGDEEEDDDGDFDPLESERFVAVYPIPSNEGFRWMERFAASQENDRVRERLLDALDRPRPFRRFRDTLAELGPVRDAWHRYEEERLREEAEAWLDAADIDAELVDTHAPRESHGGEDE
ncbi:MAG TPA: UPF0158 family protein [Longimicrobium sp.]|nr:UPF0158 family protein [Longimicrobium sp.]